MSDRKNYFILLGIDPDAPWSDDEFKKILKKNKAKWSNEKNPKKKKIYEGYREQIPQIQEIMGNQNLREQEAENARIEQAAQEKETKNKILNYINLLNAGKGYITEQEIKKLLKEFGNNRYVNEVYIKNLLSKENISIQKQNTDEGEDEQETPELPQKTIQRIDQNLKIVSKDNLYDFLGVKTTENCDQLKAIAKDKYDRLQRQGNTDVVFTASKELASEAQQILGNEAERLKYDNYLQEKPYKFLEEDLNVIAQSDQGNILYPAQYTTLINKVRSKKLDIVAAKKYIKKYARKNSLTIIEPSNEETKTKPSNEPKKSCVHCGKLNSLTEEFCINCGASFKVQPDEDSTLTPEAEKVIEELGYYQSPGDQMEFFNRLTVELSYPINVFCELLEKVKPEIILALSIQAIKKIALEQQAQLQTNQQLLSLLSNLAQSGETDLIRWAAATAIEEIGFSPAKVFQYLAQKPKYIADKIIQEQLKRFNKRHLRNSNDYNKFVQFWTYGAFGKLREITADIRVPTDLGDWLFTTFTSIKQADNYKFIKNLVLVSVDVINLLGIQGLNNISFSLHQASYMGENALTKDENQLFEFLVLIKLNLVTINSDFLDKWKSILSLYTLDINSNNISFCQNLLIQYLQSNSPYNRFLAANTIHDGDEKFGLGKNFYQELQKNNSLMADAVYIFYYQPNLDTLNFVYNDLLSMAGVLERLSLQLSRKQVKEDCQILRQKFLAEIQQREQIFNEAIQNSLTKKASIESSFSNLQQSEEFSIFEEKDIFISSFKIPDLPNLDLNSSSEDYNAVLNNYNNILDDISQKLQVFSEILVIKKEAQNNLNEFKNFDLTTYNQNFANSEVPKIPKFSSDISQDNDFIKNIEKYKHRITSFNQKVLEHFLSLLDEKTMTHKNNLHLLENQKGDYDKLIKNGIRIDSLPDPFNAIFVLSINLIVCALFGTLIVILNPILQGESLRYIFEHWYEYLLAGTVAGFAFAVMIFYFNGSSMPNFIITIRDNIVVGTEFIISFVSKAILSSKWKEHKQQAYKKYKKSKLELDYLEDLKQKLGRF